MTPVTVNENPPGTNQGDFGKTRPVQYTAPALNRKRANPSERLATAPAAPICWALPGRGGR